MTLYWACNLSFHDLYFEWRDICGNAFHINALNVQIKVSFIYNALMHFYASLYFLANGILNAIYYTCIKALRFWMTSDVVNKYRLLWTYCFMYCTLQSNKIMTILMIFKNTIKHTFWYKFNEFNNQSFWISV